MTRRQLRPRSAWSIVRNHHQGIITWEDWERNQVMLDSNRRVNRPPILNGSAQLSGLLWCNRCGRRAKVAYDRRIQGRPFPAYMCSAMKDDKVVRFHRIPSERLDTVVVKAVLAALAAPSRDELCAVVHS